ncbi:46197_t:CDS:2, partial [Gigaspora margarita]
FRDYCGMGFMAIPKRLASTVNVFQEISADIMFFTGIGTPVKVTIARGVLDNVADLVTEEIFDWLKKKKIAEDNRYLFDRLEYKVKTLQYKSIKLITKFDKDFFDMRNKHCVFLTHERKNFSLDELENCMKEIWQHMILLGSSFYGNITYEPYIINKMIVLAFQGLNKDDSVSLFMQWDRDDPNKKKDFVTVYNDDVLKDFQGGLLAKSRLQINRVENFYYIKNYD